MVSENVAENVVVSYIKALDNQEYNAARGYLSESVRIKGPAGESFGKPNEFIGMLRTYRGKYDMKKKFADGNDVCLLYNLATSAGTAFMCSWYQVEGGKITSISTIFDPGALRPPPEQKSGQNVS